MNKKILIISLSIILIIVFILIIYLMANKIYKNNTIGMYTHLLVSSNNKDDLDETHAYVLQIYTFDKNDKCINIRVKYEFLTEEIAEEEYKNFQKVESNTNIKLNKNTVTFTDTIFSEESLSKDEVIKRFSNQSNKTIEF